MFKTVGNVPWQTGHGIGYLASSGCQGTLSASRMGYSEAQHEHSGRHFTCMCPQVLALPAILITSRLAPPLFSPAQDDKFVMFLSAIRKTWLASLKGSLMHQRVVE